MSSPLLGSLAKQINAGMKGLFLDAVLSRVAPGSGPSYDPGQGAEADYPCKAIFDSWSAGSIAGGLVASNDRKVLILAQSLPAGVAPMEGDRIALRGLTLRIVTEGGSLPAVSTDPAEAVWTVRAR